MNNNNKKINTYYAVLFLVLGLKVVATIFSSGLSVHHGKKIAQLQVQKNNLLEQHMRLSGDLSDKSSLATIVTQHDISNYISITKPLVLNSSTAVASNY